MQIPYPLRTDDRTRNGLRCTHASSRQTPVESKVKSKMKVFTRLLYGVDEADLIAAGGERRVGAVARVVDKVR